MRSNRLSVILVLLFAISGIKSNHHRDVTVSTDLGRIRGTTLKSRLGTDFYAFRGIRYANAPVGRLRFQAPEPVSRWNGTFDATTDGPMCPQPADDPSDISEDCLRLNIYTKQLSSKTGKSVLVYLHPGGYYSVSGQSKNFAGPQSLMDRDIVLVTLNYRLASLGFLSTGTADAPGNAGLKDQSMALRWVKAHIRKFGGDPNSVTLMGYSAGAMSVTLHMTSPMSRDLFHRAIVMSGSAIAQWEIPRHAQLDLVNKQARILNCPARSIARKMRCLKRKSALEFGNSLSEMFKFGGGNPIILWKPVIEKDFGQERFLTEDPNRTYQEGRFMKIPVIAGITKDEFAGPAIRVLNNETLRSQMDNDFETLAPICFLYEEGTQRSREISTALRQEFLPNGNLTVNGSLDGLAYLFSDGVIGFGMDRFVHTIAQHTTVYQYRFSYQGRYSHVYYPEDKPFGVVHHDDLLYLFVAPGVAPMLTETDPEHVTVERMTQMWSNFASKGDPNISNGTTSNDIRVSWQPYDIEKQQYLDIGTNLTMKEKLYSNRFSMWQRLFSFET